jgi:leader peptidase (prepilin peptidase)/N-methyltransferase
MLLPVAQIFGQDIEVDATGRIFAIVLLGALGAAVGSFMNVVVYRLPRKMSLSRPGSRCPRCEHPIRWHDNVPVLGWIMLRGRCRDCRAPISPRYPLVEALMTAIALGLAWKEGVPEVGPPLLEMGPLYAVDLVWFGFHFVLAAALVCLALIEFDGLVPPHSIVRAALGVGLSMLVLWPHLLGFGDLLQRGGLVAALSGMLTALVIGAGPWFSWLVSARRQRVRYATTSLAELVMVGAFVGDHAVITIGLESLALYVVTQLLAYKWPAAGRFGWAGPLALATLVWLFTVPDAVPFDPQFSENPGFRLIIAGTIMTLLSIVLQFAPPAERRPVE